MSPSRLFSPLLLLGLGASLHAAGADWPRIEGKNPGPECAEALRLAKLTFDSDAPRLTAPAPLPASSESRVVLRAKTPAGAEEGLEVDANAFEKIAKDETHPGIYWQKAAYHGHRLVVQETAMGWRGDMYAVYGVPEKVGLEALRAELKNESNTDKFPAAIWDSWQPPLVLRAKQSGQVWMIDVGQPFVWLGEWRVHALGQDGLKQRCAIAFRPDTKKVDGLLPEPVRRLAALLDKTMGSGEDEGTLQSTARLRLEVEHGWANVALRPWALDAPYNDRAEVDAGLREWARQSPVRRGSHQEILRQYPRAEAALAEYYRDRFGRNEPAAKAAAAYALDVALRTHYAFPQRGKDRGQKKPNPWRR